MVGVHVGVAGSNQSAPGRLTVWSVSAKVEYLVCRLISNIPACPTPNWQNDLEELTNKYSSAEKKKKRLQMELEDVMEVSGCGGLKFLAWRGMWWGCRGGCGCGLCRDVVCVVGSVSWVLLMPTKSLVRRLT